MSVRELQNLIDLSSGAMRERLLQLAATPQGLTRDMYIRFLSMQYHLTKGVQKYFLACASHGDLVSKIGLRKFLFDFAIEEESHYIVAERDLAELDAQPLPASLDVLLWHAYFQSIVQTRPFVRLGAACILENISKDSSDVIDRLLSKANYITPKNTRFLTIHKHGPNIPHGDQMVAAMTEAQPSPEQWNDLVFGAKAGHIFYFRMTEWALDPTREI